MTISYELAKQFKEAGWPQPPSFPFSGRIWAPDDVNYERSSECVYGPSLSELIAACPRKVGVSVFILHPWIEEGWHAAYETRSTFELGETGATPEEAVARLWLELKKQGHV